MPATGLKMFKLIIAILPKGKIKTVIPVIKGAGIFGATMLSGKGLCTKEGRRALGLRMDSAREILILLTLDSNKDKLIKLLERCAKLKTWPGYCFVVDISRVIG